MAEKGEQSMRVIITGGTGLIGNALINEMQQSDYEIIVLSRSPEKYRGQFPEAIRLIAWDARTAEGWGHLVEGARAIVNLAGENLAGKSFLPAPWTPYRRQIIRESRLNAGRAVVEAVEAAKEKPAVVIQASAVGHYGPQGDEIIVENHPPADDFLASVTIDWEKSTQPVEAMGVRRAVTRIAGIVLSTEEGALPRMLLPFKLFVGGPFGSGKQWYSWIHPKDEARAIQFLIENEPASGAFNLAAPNPLRSRDFAKAIGRAMNRPSWFPVPGLPLKLALGDVSSVVLTGQRVVPKRLTDLGFEFLYKDAETAIRALLN
jgi:uncharacterized protein (TIGR01777 family)